MMLAEISLGQRGWSNAYDGHQAGKGGEIREEYRLGHRAGWNC